MEKVSIAVVSQNIANLGGISRCVIVLIEHLNKKGIIPDYYGVYSDKDKVYNLFNRKIDYNFKRIFWPKKAILYSSWMKNLQLGFKDYDYIFIKDKLGHNALTKLIYFLEKVQYGEFTLKKQDGKVLYVEVKHQVKVN